MLAFNPPGGPGAPTRGSGAQLIAARSASKALNVHKLPCRDEATLDIPWAVPRYHSLVRISEIDKSARLPRQHNYLGQHKGTVFRRPHRRGLQAD